MIRISSVGRDVRALGSSAVPRALYEGSKKVGGHAALFRTTSKSTPLRPCLPIPPHAVSGLAAATTEDDAHLIITEGLLAFGKRLSIDAAEDWIRDPLTGQVWPTTEWWKIDIRTDNRLSDVKWTWELGRHRDLVVLARAHHLSPDDPVALDELTRLLTLWFEANPLERSIHWYSNLEIALRLIAWDQILGLVGSALPQPVIGQLELHVAQARRHILIDLPYTVSSMKNNHLLGDTLGIQIAEQMAGRGPDSYPRVVANRLWEKQLARHMGPDGSMIEDSLSYHRFVLEMFCVRKLLGDKSQQLNEILRSSANHLVDLGVMNGPVPQFGDWDEGRVLTSSTDPHSVANAAALGLALAGAPIPNEWYERFDVLSWYLPNTERHRLIESGRPAPQNGTKSVDRFSRSDIDGLQTWLKGGIGSSHGHADLGHVSARIADKWLLEDPGTGTYNGRIEIRNGFRTSQAHNVLRIGNEDQLGPHRAFRWQRAPWAQTGVPLEMAADVHVLWSVNNAYSTLPGVARSLRAVVASGSGLVVVDWTEAAGSFDFSLTIPIAAESRCFAETVQISHGSPTLVEGQEAPWRGWHSDTYGQWEPAPWIIVEGNAQGPVWWSIGSVAEVSATGDTVRIGDLTLLAEWHPQAAHLHAKLDQGDPLIGVVRGPGR